MANKKAMEVLIDGRLYTLATEESGEFVQRVVNYFNGKIAEFKKNPSYRRLNKDYQNTLIALNIADDLFKSKEKLLAAKEELHQKERELRILQGKFDNLQVEYVIAKKMLEEKKKESKKESKKKDE